MSIRNYISIVLILLASNMVKSQGYTTAMGIRLGTEWGVTLNQVLWDKISLEGLYQSGFSSPQYGITGMVKFHNSVIGRRVNFFYGGGFHKFWEKGETVDYIAGSGLTIIVGGEISLGKFNISYDFKPILNVFGGTKKFESQTGISLRYVIIKKAKWGKIKRKRKRAKRKRKRKKINWKFWKKK